MCAQFLIKANLKDLERTFGIIIPDELLPWSERILPHTMAPVAIKNQIKRMNFSLVPSWSKDRKPKFATHNARIETIDEKATWKKPFLTQHCVIPMNTFIEPIYTGELAGNMVRFNSSDILIAAGVFDVWMDPSTGEIVESFAVITTEPCDFIAKVGHDRQPIFLDKTAANDWLHAEGSAQELKSFLFESSVEPKLVTEIDRPMKAGWQKRIP